MQDPAAAWVLRRGLFRGSCSGWLPYTDRQERTSIPQVTYRSLLERSAEVEHGWLPGRRSRAAWLLAA